MNDELLIQIDRKIAEHFAEVAKLQAARKALSGSNGTNGSAPVAAAPKKHKRTPVGDDVKKRVIELTKEGGRTIPQIAAECGISEKSVVRIRKKARSKK